MSDPRYNTNNPATRKRKRRRRRRRRNYLPLLCLFLAVVLFFAIVIKFCTRDTEAPFIYGAVDSTYAVGDTVLYRSGVTATDKRDGEVEVLVDASGVDASTPGTYPVIYSAVDSAGNRTSVTVYFTFEEREPEEILVKPTINDEPLNAALESITAQVYNAIIRDGMTDSEKAEAIWTWVHKSIQYTGDSEKVEWQEGALTAFRTLSGDCFAYFTAAKALLIYADIPSIDVTKIKMEGRSNHYWLLVQINGSWYHLDACPRVAAEGNTFCLYTDEQMLEFSEKNNDCFDFDLRLYPRTPGEIADRFLIKFYPKWFDDEGNRLPNTGE